MKKRNKRFWAWMMSFLMILTMANGIAAPVETKAAADGDMLLDAATAATQVKFSGEWFDTYDTIYVNYSVPSDKIGWGVGGVCKDWSTIIETTATAVNNTMTMTVEELKTAAGVTTVEELKALTIRTNFYNDAYLTSIEASVGGGAKTTVVSSVDLLSNVTNAALDWTWFNSYDAITITYAGKVAGHENWGIGGLQDGTYTNLIEFTANSSSATSQNSKKLTKADVLKVTSEGTALNFSFWEGYIVKIVGNKSASSSTTSEVTLVTGGEGMTWVTIDKAWFDTYSKVTVSYKGAATGKEGWGAGAISYTEGEGGNTSLSLSLNSSDSTQETSVELTKDSLMTACSVETWDEVPGLAINLWGFDGCACYITSVVGTKAATTGGSGSSSSDDDWISKLPIGTPTPTPTPSPVPTEAPAGDDATGDTEQVAQVVKAGDKIKGDFSAYLDDVDKIVATFTSDGYFNGCLGLSIDDAWDQIEPSSNGGTVTWEYDGISGRNASGYYEIQIWYTNEGVNVTLDSIELYDADGNLIGDKEDEEPAEEPEPTEEPKEPVTPGKKKIVRVVESDEVTEVSKKDDFGIVIDAEGATNLWQLPMADYAGNGKLVKILLTITFDQTAMKYWTGGGGAYGYSTDGEWVQEDFEHAFIDGSKNTKVFEIVIPEGVTATFDSGSIFQVGWWWGSTSTITVDSVEFIFEKRDVTEIEIEVNENALMTLDAPGEQLVALKELAEDLDYAAVDKVVLNMASTGKCKGSVYMKRAEANPDLLWLFAEQEDEVKLGEFSMNGDGYETFTFDGLAGTLEGDIRVEIEEIEEGATVVLDSLVLLGEDDEELANSETVLTEDPAEDTEEPSEDVEEPTEDTEEPAEEPTEDIENPTEDTEEPAEEPSEDIENPTEDTEEPSEDTEAPAEDAKKPEEDAELPKTGRADAAVFYLFGIALGVAGLMVYKKKEERA
ncbi:MAG: LPXTG cell wall anchor domain-containing protein [Lachnospiraceae bacterium]|nr:LPXTG cell wall anchor domain-containing protein [Lachnospiraceae bacterium]